MIKSIDFPNETFETKEQLFLKLKEHSKDLIDLKRSTIKESDGVFISKHVTASKGMQLEDGYIYAVINSTNILDSHNDLHLKGLWTKSVKEQQGRIYFLTDHEMKLSNVVAYPSDVEMLLEDIPFKDLGFNSNVKSECLIFKVNKDKIRHSEANTIIKEGLPIQHSVKMKYIKIALCVNSELTELKDENDNYHKYISEVANKEVADELGYFWAVTEAQVYQEGSMVLAGSNHITPLLMSEKEAVKSINYFDLL